MYAAFWASDETVAFLLSKGASPDFVANNNMTALAFAIQSEYATTIDLLSPVTMKCLGGALQCIASYHTQMTPAVESFMTRAASDKDVTIKDVAYATLFGNIKMSRILTQGWDKYTLDSTDANQLLEKALMSDNAETVDTIRAFVTSVSS